MSKYKPDDSPDFWIGVFRAIPLALGLWSLILVLGSALGWLVDQVVDGLLLGVHLKLAITTILIVLGLFALERVLKWISGDRS